MKLREGTGDSIVYGVDWYATLFLFQTTAYVLAYAHSHFLSLYPPSTSLVHPPYSISEKGSVQLAQSSFSPTGGHLICLLFDMGKPVRSDVKTEAIIGYTMLGVDAPWGKYLVKTTPEDRAIYVRWAKLSTSLFESELIKVSAENVSYLL